MQGKLDSSEDERLGLLVVEEKHVPSHKRKVCALLGGEGVVFPHLSFHIEEVVRGFYPNNLIASLVVPCPLGPEFVHGSPEIGFSAHLEGTLAVPVGAKELGSLIRGVFVYAHLTFEEFCPLQYPSLIADRE